MLTALLAAKAIATQRLLTSSPAAERRRINTTFLLSSEHVASQLFQFGLVFFFSFSPCLLSQSALNHYCNYSEKEELEGGGGGVGEEGRRTALFWPPPNGLVVVGSRSQAAVSAHKCGPL
jgi:hypothetical protein